MADQRPFQVRQAILETLANSYPGGRGIDRLLLGADIQPLGVSREELLREARVLEAAEFLVDLKPRLEPHWKITFEGMCQIRREKTPDEVVWGESAL